MRITLVHTPGHTPGSQCFFVDGMLVSGDTLFLDGCGRTDLPGGDPEALYESLTQKLAHDPGRHRALPGPPLLARTVRATRRGPPPQLRLPPSHHGPVDDDVRQRGLLSRRAVRVPDARPASKPQPSVPKCRGRLALPNCRRSLRGLEDGVGASASARPVRAAVAVTSRRRSRRTAALAILKVAIPDGLQGQSPFARSKCRRCDSARAAATCAVLRTDTPRRAMLQERLGRPLAALGYPVEEQIDIDRGDAAARCGNQCRRPSRCAPGAEQAAWLREYVRPRWVDLDRPCPESVITTCRQEYAASRRDAFDASTAVLIHGDAHPANVPRGSERTRSVQAHRSGRDAIGARATTSRSPCATGPPSCSRATRSRSVSAWCATARGPHGCRTASASGNGRSSNVCRPASSCSSLHDDEGCTAPRGRRAMDRDNRMIGAGVVENEHCRSKQRSSVRCRRCTRRSPHSPSAT